MPEKKHSRGRHGRILEPTRLPDDVRAVPGKWVAIKDGELVAVRETPGQLLVELKERGIRGARVLRAPAEHDVELVGLG